jgi:hypothetical protein
MKPLAPVFTAFDRSAVPTNLLTVADWRRFAAATTDWQRQFRQAAPTAWEKAARCFACAKGGALVWRANDSLVVFTKRGDKISRRTYKPGTWGWTR